MDRDMSEQTELREALAERLEYFAAEIAKHRGDALSCPPSELLREAAAALCEESREPDGWIIETEVADGWLRGDIVLTRAEAEATLSAGERMVPVWIGAAPLPAEPAPESRGHRGGDMTDTERTRSNFNPHREARLAMLVYHREYAAQSGGVMDFYESLPSATRLMLNRWCDELDATRREATEGET